MRGGTARTHRRGDHRDLSGLRFVRARGRGPPLSWGCALVGWRVNRRRARRADVGRECGGGRAPQGRPTHARTGPGADSRSGCVLRCLCRMRAAAWFTDASPARVYAGQGPQSGALGTLALKTGMAGDRHRGFEIPHPPPSRAHTNALTCENTGCQASAGLSGRPRICPTSTSRLRLSVPVLCPRGL